EDLPLHHDQKIVPKVAGDPTAIKLEHYPNTDIHHSCPLKSSTSHGTLKTKDKEKLASTSHVAETDLLPQKRTYKDSLQCAASIARPIHIEEATTNSEGKGPTKEVQSYVDVCFSYGLIEGALGESSMVQGQTKSRAEGCTYEVGGWKASEQEGYHFEDGIEDVDIG
ncbi:hypothetical protein U1Q18_007964, partial [Sarracenia purpurea var. burkii]